ncbi:MAG: Gfo/Idh/MocA family oxidoreductase [Treponema sp.]|jgi:predicted dehydrogenase|nr:Gfo/Idh/MocA family oxidoreductase [Treponema sp.]
MAKRKIGIIGCGNISGNYLAHAKKLYADIFEVSAVSDINIDLAKKRAEEYEIPLVLSTTEMLEAEDIELIVNLTVPTAHYGISKSVLQAGKHIYSEKPFALTRSESLDVLKTAETCGRQAGCAPDTFLGMPIQTAIKCVQAGYIGKIIGAHCVCFHPTHGNENWHPEPAQYYKKGAGPMLDMGAYYFNALVALAGPVESVMCYQTLNFPERKINTLPHRNELIHVEVPTHVVGMFQFKNGAAGSIINTLDAWNSKQPWIEIYGDEGTLVLPDPGNFKGDVFLSRLAYGENMWTKVPDLVEYKETARGIGIVDMLSAIDNERPLRASGELAAHITDIVAAFDESASTGKRITLSSTCIPPKPRWEPYSEKDTVL